MRDIAWAAGIFEGEGTAGHWDGSTKVHVVQKGDWLPLRLQALFGGGIYFKSKGRYALWSLGGPRARGFLLTIFPFLSPRRREQVRRALCVPPSP